MSTDGLVKVSGIITELHPKSGDNWSRFRFEDEEGNSRWAVAKWKVEVGQVIEFEGIFDVKFKSYNVVRQVESTAVTNTVVSLYLVHHLDGVGVVRARKLSEKYPNLFQAILDNPAEIAEECGASPEDLQLIVEQLTVSQQNLSRVSRLLNLGWPNALANKAASVESWYQTAVTCPYAAIKLINGLGWTIADEIGRKWGIPYDSESRVCAAIDHYFSEEVIGNGHTIISIDELLQPDGIPGLLGGNTSNLVRLIHQELIEVGDGEFTNHSYRKYSQIIQDFVLR